MSRTIPYDPTRRSLYKPCAHAVSLNASATLSEGLLCAELSRLVYCAFEKDAVTQHEVASQLTAIGFSGWACWPIAAPRSMRLKTR